MPAAKQNRSPISSWRHRGSQRRRICTALPLLNQPPPQNV